MTDLLVLDLRVKDGRGHVILADQAGDPLAGRHITLEFPLDHQVAGNYPEMEEQLVRDAQAVLREASAALKER